MDPLMAKAQGKVGSSSTKPKSSPRKKKQKSSRDQTAGQPSGRPPLGTSGEPTSELLGGGRSKSGKQRKDNVHVSYSNNKSSTDGKAASMTMNTLHVIDTAIGITCIVGGAIMHHSVQVMTRPISFGTLLISFGSLVLLGSLCGFVGYFSTSCHRNGLVVGMFVGGVACLVYVGGMIWGLVSWDSFVAFVDGEEEFLADKKIDVIFVLAVLAVVETIRIITTGITRNQLLQKDSQSKPGSYRSTSTGTSSSTSSRNFLSWFGLAKKKRSDDFVMFDDNASMESALLWSKDGGQPSSDDYLEFVPEHERGLASYASNAVMPLPPEDKTDY